MCCLIYMADTYGVTAVVNIGAITSMNKAIVDN